AARDRQVARAELIKRFKLSEIQAQRISDMTLSQVTKLDLAGYRNERRELLQTIAYLEDLLPHEPKLIALVKEEMQAVADEFGDDRRTSILANGDATLPVVEVQAAIESKPTLVALTADGALKAMPANTYSGKTNAGTVRGDDKLVQVERALAT